MYIIGKYIPNLTGHVYCSQIYSILLKCGDFITFRQHWFNVNSMRDFFTNVKHKQIFLKTTGSTNLSYFL